MDKQKNISLAVAVILILGIGYFIYKDLGSSGPGTMATTTLDGSGIVSDDNPSVSGELPNPDAVVPNLDRKFVIPDTFSKEIIQNTMVQYNGIITSLKADPTLRNEWLQLAILRKAVEDYKGAEEIWLYVILKWPLDHVAFGNLGNLYLDFLVDNNKAEEYLLQAIEKSPVTLQYTENLYNLYMHRQKNPEKAISLLSTMRQNFLEQVYFPLKMAEHYRDTGDVKNAKQFFEVSRDLAKTQQQQNVIDYAETELAKLK